MQRSTTTPFITGPRGLFFTPKPVSHIGRCPTSLVCKAGGNGVDPKADADKQREVTKMLLATQKNLLLINNSRVKMQEELAVANKKIQDLEREVERLRAETAAAEAKALKEAQLRDAQLPPPFTVNPPPSFTPGQQQQQQHYQHPMQQQQRPPSPGQQQRPPSPPPQPMQQQQYRPPMQQQQPAWPQQQQQQQPVFYQQHQLQSQQQQQHHMSPPSSSSSPAPPAIINLTYITGWHNAFIHHSVDGKPWTATPGTRMTQSSQDHNTKTIIIEGRKVEFVMTNGENDWDSPGRYTDKPKNYEINGPGTYRLKSGKVEKLQ